MGATNSIPTETQQITASFRSSLLTKITRYQKANGGMSRNAALDMIVTAGLNALKMETTTTSAMKRAPGRAKTMAAGGSN